MRNWKNYPVIPIPQYYSKKFQVAIIREELERPSRRSNSSVLFETIPSPDNSWGIGTTTPSFQFLTNYGDLEFFWIILRNWKDGVVVPIPHKLLILRSFLNISTSSFIFFTYSFIFLHISSYFLHIYYIKEFLSVASSVGEGPPTSRAKNFSKFSRHFP